MVLSCNGTGCGCWIRGGLDKVGVLFIIPRLYNTNLI
jgi:hypothetical protein